MLTGSIETWLISDLFVAAIMWGLCCGILCLFLFTVYYSCNVPSMPTAPCHTTTHTYTLVSCNLSLNKSWLLNLYFTVTQISIGGISRPPKRDSLREDRNKMKNNPKTITQSKTLDNIVACLFQILVSSAGDFCLPGIYFVFHSIFICSKQKLKLVPLAFLHYIIQLKFAAFLQYGMVK